ncbi:MAG: glycosyltransferase [Candidatus Omnitrophica bacterium]|nr:glycosyltransferase [Candidatus Omnitrophota bacterium]
MKIALVFNKERGGTTGEYFESPLVESGHAVRHFWTRDALQMPSDFDLYIRIDHGDYKFDLPSFARPAVFYAIDTHLKRSFKKIACQAGHYDLVLCAQREGALRLRAKGIEARWLPLGCDPRVHAPDRELDRDLDIAFVGTDGKKSHRRELLESLKLRYPDSFFGMAEHTEMRNIYGRARVVFNYGIRNDINMRVFEGMCAGALMVTNAPAGSAMEELFEEGHHLVVYKSDADLYEKLDYYLSHEQDRQAIAMRGQERVLQEHTYARRVLSLLNTSAHVLGGRYEQLKSWMPRVIYT